MKSKTLLATVLAVFAGSTSVSAQDLVWDQGTVGDWIDVDILHTGSFPGVGPRVVVNDDVPSDPRITMADAVVYDDGNVNGGQGATGAGNGGSGYCEIDSVADGIAEVNPDLQPLASWSGIHGQVSFSDARGGGGGGANAFAGGNPGQSGQTAIASRVQTGINVPLTLSVTPSGNPLATVSGTFEVVFGWGHAEFLDGFNPGSTPGGWTRSANFNLGTNDAWLLVQPGSNGDLEAIYQTNDPGPGGTTNVVVVSGFGALNGTSGSLFCGRGECVDNTMAAGEQGFFNGNMLSSLNYAANAGDGAGGSPISPTPDSGDGMGGVGGAGVGGGFDGGAGDYCDFTTNGIMEGWVGIFAGGW